jgi:glyoxylate reductase
MYKNNEGSPVFTGSERRIMKVLITHHMPEDVVQRIAGLHEVSGHFEHRPMAPERLLDEVKDKNGVLCIISDVIDEAVLKAAPHLKIVANFGVGYNNIDVAAAARRGILVTNTPDVLTDATADLALALILAVGRRLVEGDRMVRRQQFRYWAPFHFLGREISGKTLGIVGLGRIGRAVARRAAGFKMQVVYHNRRRLPMEEEKALGLTYLPFDQVLACADYLSLHVPLTAETHHLIGASQLARMKPGAFLINTSRGPVVDEQALSTALQNGRLAGAGLDVYENEPEVAQDLLQLDQVVLLPHVGSATRETRHRMASLAADNLLAGLAGQSPPNRVN